MPSLFDNRTQAISLSSRIYRGTRARPKQSCGLGASSRQPPLFRRSRPPQPIAEASTLSSNKESIMIDGVVRWTPAHGHSLSRMLTHSRAGCLALLLSILCLTAFIESAGAQDSPREQYIPVLCVTTGEKPAGMVIHLMVLFAKRDDTGGLDVHFLSGPGRFSQKAQAAATQAITGVARAMGLSTDSWSVGLSVPYPGLIIDGDSLSAMVGLAVVAMAKGDALPRHRVISGTVTSDGRIGPVGDVALKVTAAHQAGLHTVFVPSATPHRWNQPLPIHVSQVSTVIQAYRALMMPDSLIADSHLREPMANRS